PFTAISRASRREDDPTVPTSPYGSSKLMTEIMLRDASTAHGLPCDPALFQRRWRRPAWPQWPIYQSDHAPHHFWIGACLAALLPLSFAHADSANDRCASRRSTFGKTRHRSRGPDAACTWARA